MKIIVRPAVPEDTDTIMQIMHTAHAAMQNPMDYILDDAPYIRHHIQRDGFALIAEADGVPAGFFVVKVPGSGQDNLGRYLQLPEEQLLQVAEMDTSAVLPDYQGKGIMGAMFREAVARTQQPIMLGTVAPQNFASRRNYEKCGFTCAAEITKHNGYQRLLMALFREIP